MVDGCGGAVWWCRLARCGSVWCWLGDTTRSVSYMVTYDMYVSTSEKRQKVLLWVCVCVYECMCEYMYRMYLCW